MPMLVRPEEQLWLCLKAPVVCLHGKMRCEPGKLTRDMAEART